METTNSAIMATKSTRRTVRPSLCLLLFTLLLGFIAPRTHAERWEDVGEGRLIDGWFSKGQKLKVLIQKDLDKEGRYRLWHPFENFEQQAGVKNTSKMNTATEGQIVFDIEDPTCVLIEPGHCAGFTNNDFYAMGFTPGTEYVCTNDYGYVFNLLGSSIPREMAKGYIEMLQGKKSTYDPTEKVVYIPRPVVSEEEGQINSPSNIASYIYFPDDVTPELPTEKEELQEGQWTSLGMGKLIGWFTEDQEWEVEIQQNIANKNRYRVWEPFKNVPNIDSKDNKTVYHGQIVFDVSDPDYVLMFWGKPSGYYDKDKTEELFVANQLGLYYSRDRGDSYVNDPAQMEQFLSVIKKKLDDENAKEGVNHTTTYADGVVTISNPLFTTFKISNISSYEIPSQIILPITTSETEIWEKEEDQWKDYGIGKLHDGWVTDGQEFDVLIQQDVENSKRFRVWEPYKDLEGRNSEYHGQIVFDISDPDCVMIEDLKPIGLVEASTGGEMYAINDYRNNYNSLVDIIGEELARKAAIDQTIKSGTQTTYSESRVNISNAKYLIEGNPILNATDREAWIEMPPMPGNWTINADDDYFSFTFDGTQVEAPYDSENNCYTFNDVTDNIVFEATVRPEYISYLVQKVDVEPTGGTITIAENGKSFSFNKKAFAGDFVFTPTVAPVSTSWYFSIADDYLSFELNGEPLDIEFDNELKSYSIENVENEAVLVATIRPEFIEDYTIVSIKPSFDKNATQTLQTKVARSPKLNDDGSIATDGTSFTINMADFVGAFKFEIETEYIGPLVLNVSEPIVSVTESSAYIRIKYDSSLVPEDAAIKVYYGPSSDEPDKYTDFVVGLASGASLNIIGLTPETGYEYTLLIVVYYDNGEVIKSNKPMNVAFRTNSKPGNYEGVNAQKYMWDTTSYPENKYGICTFFSYTTTQPSWAPAVLKPDFSAVLGTRFSEAHANGVREVTLHFAHMLPNPPKVTDDEIPFVRGKWFLVKNPKSEVNAKETFYLPDITGGTIGEDGIYIPAEQIVESGETYDKLKYVEMMVHEKHTPPDDPRWDIDLLDYFAIDTRAKFDNVILTIGFDESDDTYENPKYIKMSYEREPMTALIGTIAQTSPLYNPENDKTGGWQTWVPLTPTGDDENPYPYVYDFIAQEKTYDLSFTFDNKRLLKVLETGEGGVLPLFALEEVYPHNMAWNADFETPDDWHSKTRGRQIRAQQTNYYPGYIGPYVNSSDDSEKQVHAPKFIESILLTDLVPGHHYQLVLEHPSYGWENDKEDEYSDFTYVDNALGYITLIDYDANLGNVEAFQLVKDTKETDVYYTYDFRQAGKTYKVLMNDKNVVSSYQKVTSINESVDYMDPRYEFTDKIFVFAHDYEYDEVNQKNVSVKVLSATLEMSIADSDMKETIDVSGEDLVIGKVFAMKGVNRPLDPKNFDLKNFKLTYQRGYTTCDDNTLELFVTDRPVTHRLRWHYEGNIPKAPRLYDPETIKLSDVSVNDLLTVPTPASGITNYSLSTNRNVTGDASNTINIRFYAEDLVNDGYTQDTYTLPDLGLHSHDYHITFSYYPPNVTSDFAEVLEAENEDDGAPNIRFNLAIISEDGTYDNVNLFSEDNTLEVGFYNADMGYIYDKDQNQSLVPSCTMTYGSNRPHFEHYYERWTTDEVANVELDLTAPEVGVVEYNEMGRSEDENKTLITAVYRQIVELPGTGEKVLALCAPGFSLINTDDAIVDSNNPDLVTGDNDDAHTTLYLIEYDGVIMPDNEKGEPYRILLSKEQVKEHSFPIIVLERNYDGEELESGEVDLTPYANETYSFNVRNVYLFPIANDGFKSRDDADLPETVKSKAAANGPVTIADATPGNQYHGITTPSTTHTLYFNPGNVTGADDLNGEGIETLAVVSPGVITVIADGASLYRTDGTLLGFGKGSYSVVPGVYVVAKGENRVKVLVK